MTSGTPSIKDLSSELHSVSNWHQLGIKLGLQPYKLRQIEEETKDVERRKVEILDLWRQSTLGASWKMLVTALREMGENITAIRIEEKYKTSASSPPEVKKKVNEFLRENRQNIISKFAKLQTNVCKKMSTTGDIDLEQFCLFATNLFPPGDCIPHSPTSLTEVFKAITNHGLWDFFHYSPLVKVVEEFGAHDPDMKEWIQCYKNDLRSYNMMTTLTDCIELELANPTGPSLAKYDPRYNCPVEWKTNFVDHTLQYLAEVWELFSTHYLLPDYPPTALLDRVCRGCVSITWLVPTHMIPQLIKGIESSADFFQESKISKVTVDGKCVYEACSVSMVRGEGGVTGEEMAVATKGFIHGRKMFPINVPLLETTKAKLCGHGKYPSVTMNNSNTIVAVHNSDIGSTLKCRVGVVSEVDGSFSVDWGKDRQYGTGFFPRVSMNNDGIVVEVHQSLMREVRYRIGKVNEATKTIDWWQEIKKIEDGYAPAVALTDNGHVVVAYESKKFAKYKTYYRLGTINFELKTIDWNDKRITYGNGGQNLSISMNNEGTIVEVHRSPAGVNFSHLWLCIGKLKLDHQDNPESIIWNDSVAQGKYRNIDRFLPSSWSHPQSSPYSNGYYPFVSINNDGILIEAHQTTAWRHLVYRAGVVDGETIRWSSKDCQYDTGWAPVVALNDQNQVVEIHENAYVGNMWWSKIGKLAVP